jgi:hypothetical protein
MTFPNAANFHSEVVLIRGVPVRLGVLLCGNARNVPGATTAVDRWQSQLYSDARAALFAGQRDYARSIVEFLSVCRARRGY